VLAKFCSVNSGNLANAASAMPSIKTLSRNRITAQDQAMFEMPCALKFSWITEADETALIRGLFMHLSFANAQKMFAISCCS